MAVFKDETRNTYYVKTYYIDYTGEKKQKKKRGFKLKKDAVNWEREFLLQMQGEPDMTLNSLAELYLKDIKTRLKEITYDGHKHLLENRILPYLGNKPINLITPADIRNWQNTQISTGYSDAYLKRMNNLLVATFNFAVRFYNLKDNPCCLAGSMGKRKRTKITFWTKEEYFKFIALVDDITKYTMFQTLYYTGMRIGELLALTYNDIDLDNGIIRINKTVNFKGGKVNVTSPKTPKSNREITIPQLLVNDLNNYIKRIYDYKNTDRVFPYTKAILYNELKTKSEQAGLKKIRVHDFRHSHASLLIDMGINPLLISERLGHEKVETTLNTYSHLYPSRADELAEKLNKIVPL
ncbi:tyrosine-type recombinase/integrase [Eubacterium ventriosum]|uniref:tyrosine-type recombinase/integrase n=1 Tax=Eubacterium ventriosum TaxID=39496 RepID=UPI001C00C9CA|nr:site-specific integrase [Eubacterium ventriosum]MBT9699139.1 tyrosine-type recombinase/integrase [Eubacterium ventriosum]